MTQETVVIPKGYLRAFLIILVIQTLLLLGIGALTVWINFKINWFQSGSPDTIIDSVLPLLYEINQIT
jgi:hypothetical protein